MGKVHLPASLHEVFDMLSGEPRAALYAGGTDIFAKSSLISGDGRPFVCLERVAELKGISDLGDEVRIGACTTHTEIVSNRLIGDNFPLLKQAAAHIGSPAIRNMGTIGGNICTASPAGDTLPPLYIYDAEVELRKGDRVRRLPVGGFIRGPGQTMLDAGEVLCAVCIRKGHGFTVSHFEKAGQRRAMAISVASFAFAAALHEDGTVKKARCAFGSVAPTVLTLRPVDDHFTGRRIDGPTLTGAAALVRDGVLPISDVRASKEYRRMVAGNLVMRLESTHKAIR